MKEKESRYKSTSINEDETSPTELIIRGKRSSLTENKMQRDFNLSVLKAKR